MSENEEKAESARELERKLNLLPTLFPSCALPVSLARSLCSPVLTVGDEPAHKLGQGLVFGLDGVLGRRSDATSRRWSCCRFSRRLRRRRRRDLDRERRQRRRGAGQSQRGHRQRRYGRGPPARGRRAEPALLLLQRRRRAAAAPAPRRRRRG